MINSQNLIDKICAKISLGGLTSLETCQTTGALTILSNPIVSVATKNDLPDVTLYRDRMIYVDDENRYYYAADGIWLNDFTSNPVNYNNALMAWGANFSSQLGDSTTTDTSSPIYISSEFTDWRQVSGTVSGNFSVGIRSNGTAWAWGLNSSGQLGNGTLIDRSSPTSVIGGITNWVQISGGNAHSLGLRSNGTAWAWGAGSNGRIGDNTNVLKCSPVLVVGGFTNWCQVSAGGLHSLGVRSNGTAWAWGAGANGRLGNNATTDRSSPVSVVGGFTDWCQVSAGTFHSLGVRTNGSAWAWGDASSGKLGDNTAVSKSSPVSVVGGFADWCQVSGGEQHSLGVRTNGTAWAWGNNSNGRLGDGTGTTRSSPVSVIGGFTDWCQVSGGFAHSLGIRQNGTLWGWGINTCGRLGNGTIIQSTSPVPVLGGFTDWCQVSAGRYHSLGVRQICKGF